MNLRSYRKLFKYSTSYTPFSLYVVFPRVQPNNKETVVRKLVFFSLLLLLPHIYTCQLFSFIFEMARRPSLPFLTKERRPWLLSLRSSQSFIITTVSLSMFTVSSLGPDFYRRNDRTKLNVGPLSLHNGMNFHGVMDTGLCLKVIDCTHHAQRIGFPSRCQF